MINQFFNNRLMKESGVFSILGIFGSILNLATLSLVAKNLPKSEFGQYSLFLVFIGLGTIPTLNGFKVCLNKALLRKKYSFTHTAIVTSLKFSVSSFAILVSSILLFNHLTGGEFSRTTMPLFYASFILLILPLDRGETIFQSLNSFRSFRIITILYALLNLLFVGANAYLWKDLSLVFIGFLCAKSISVATGIFLGLRQLKGKKDESNLTNEQLKKEGYQLSALAVFNSIFKHLDRLVLNGLSSVTLATYQAGLSLPDRLKDQIKNFSLVAEQTWLRMGKDTHDRRLRKFFLPFLTMLAICCVFLIVGAYWYVPLLFGEKYLDAIPIAQVLSISIFFKLATGFLESREIVFQDTKFYQKAVYITRLTYIGLLVALTSQYQAIGAALAMLIADILNFTLQVGIYLYREKIFRS